MITIIVHGSSIIDIELVMTSGDTVSQLQNKIQEKLQISPAKQLLIFENKKLENNETLRYDDIYHFSKVELIRLSEDGNLILNIINISGIGFGRITMNCNPGDKVADVMARIFDNAGIPINEQCLTFAGKQLDRRFSLADYNITNDSTLHVHKKVSIDRKEIFHQMSFKVQSLLEMFSIECTCHEPTVKQIKIKIAEQKDVPLERQRLFACGEELNNDHRINLFAGQFALTPSRPRPTLFLYTRSASRSNGGDGNQQVQSQLGQIVSSTVPEGAFCVIEIRDRKSVV